MQKPIRKTSDKPLQQMTLKTRVVKVVEMPYLIYFPQNFEKEKRDWPLLVFLHGAGERGNNLELVTRHGPPKLIKQGGQFPFIMVAPQCPEYRWWDVDELDAWLEALLKKLPVDQSRLYLTGLSMGGFATWAWATKHPERFAAIAPICGGGNPVEADRLKNIAVWAFHGAKDTVVPLQRSQEMVEALKKLNAEVKFTVYPQAGHDAWTATYDNSELYDWFLRHSKRQ